MFGLLWESAVVDQAEYLLLRTDTKENSVAIMNCLRSLREVEEVYFATGEWSFVAKVAGDLNECKEKVLNVRGVQSARVVRIHPRW